MIKDLQAEASFFDTTACEVAEGLLEIREEYVEENTSGRTSESGDLQIEDEDEEYAHIMSKLDELEQEELAAEIENRSGENKQNSVAESDNEDGEVEEAKIVFDQFSDLNSPDHNLGHSEVQAVSRDAKSDGKSMVNSAKAAAAAAAKALILSEVKENVAVASLSRKEAFTGSIVEHPYNIQTNPQEQSVSSSSLSFLNL